MWHSEEIDHKRGEVRLESQRELHENKGSFHTQQRHDNSTKGRGRCVIVKREITREEKYA